MSGEHGSGGQGTGGRAGGGPGTGGPGDRGPGTSARTTGPIGRAARGTYRLALRAFPTEHRTRYAGDMVDAFERECAERRGHGALPAARYCAEACIDAVLAGWGERRRRARTEGRSGSWYVGLRHDFTHAVRGLARSWTYTLVCLLSLSCGLGVAMAVFLLVRQTIEPPFELGEDGLVELFVRDAGRLHDGWSYPDFSDVSTSLTELELVATAVAEGTLRTGEGEAGRGVRVAYVSPSYFELLGVTPTVGRSLQDAEAERSGAEPAVVARHVWESWLVSDPDVIGHELVLDRIPHVVVGVAPPRFRHHHVGRGVDVFVPLTRHPYLAPESAERFDRDASWLQVLGRVPDGTSEEEASAMLASVMGGLASEHPETNAERGAAALPYRWQGAAAGDDIALLFYGIFGGIEALVLLIVSLNIGGMVLARSASRERELALRLALGSSRRRLVQYLMAEALVIGVGGGIAILAVLWLALRAIEHRVGPLPPTLMIDAGSAAVCMVLAVGAAMAFGLAPALRFSRPGLVSSIRDDAGGGGRKSGRLHRIAVAAQIGLSVPVLIVAGSVSHGARSMTTADFGLEDVGLMISARMDLTAQGYDAASVQRLARALREDVAGLAGVRAVSVADHTPMDGVRSGVGVSDPERGTSAGSRISRVDDRFFETMGMPVLRGRAFNEDDLPGADPVAIMTAGVAERLFEGEDPLGRRVELALAEGPAGGESAEHRAFTVIGVTGEVAGPFLESDTDNVFLSYWQEPGPVLTLAVRSASTDEAIATAIQDAWVALDPELARPVVLPFDAVVEARGRDMPVWSVFFTIVSSLLLALSALGIYGIVAFAVANRTREIGVRMSLGSTRRRVLEGVVRDAVLLAAPGLVIGGGLGVLVGQRILNRMYAQIGLPMADARIMVAAGLLALLVAVVASLAPARRAATVDPMEALRAE